MINLYLLTALLFTARQSPRLLCVAKIKLGISLVMIEMQVEVVLNFVVASAKIFTIWL